MSRGTITITNLIVHAVIGVYAFEQAIRQPLRITLSFVVDIERAASQDALALTIDYAAVCGAIHDFVEATSCRLLEAFVKRLADHLKASFSMSELSITVTKTPKDLPYIDGISINYEVSW